eukprot:482384-Pyramimonas_sp.AAC.1
MPSGFGKRLQMSRRRDVQRGRQVATQAMVRLRFTVEEDYDAVDFNRANAPERTWAATQHRQPNRSVFLANFASGLPKLSSSRSPCVQETKPKLERNQATVLCRILSAYYGRLGAYTAVQTDSL